MHWCLLFTPIARYIVIDDVKPISAHFYFILFLEITFSNLEISIYS